MSAEPHTPVSDDHCAECGLPSAVKLNDRPMCGHCFHLGISAAQSDKLHRWNPRAITDPSVQEVVHAALREFDVLRKRIDSILETIDSNPVAFERNEHR